MQIFARSGLSASSRGREGQLPHVPSRGSPSMPKVQEGTPVLVKEGVLSQLDFDRSIPGVELTDMLQV